jgi:hypothetical protein
METVRIRDPGWKKVGSGIRDKHPGSATLISKGQIGTYRGGHSYKTIRSRGSGSDCVPDVAADPDPTIKQGQKKTNF